MRVAIVALIAVAGVGTARVARGLAGDLAPSDALAGAPFAPSPGAAPFVSLGYRELAADLLFIRFLGYFGGPDHEGHAMASLVEAITTLDPTFRRPYEIGAVAITAAHRGVDNEVRLRAIHVLEQAAAEFPANWRYPSIAGQIYLVDLETKDPAQRRAWDERGAQLLESAVRKPNASAEAFVVIAALRTRLGQQQRAIDGMRELLLTTDDRGVRKSIIDKIASLSHEDADQIAAELLEQRHLFDREWRTARPALPASLYVVIGPRPPPGFDLVDLATGGHDLIAAEGFHPLEPLTDPAP